MSKTCDLIKYIMNTILVMHRIINNMKKGYKPV